MIQNNSLSQQTLEATERYIDNSMDAIERLDFDTRLNDDAAFRTQFEETKSLILGIESAVLKNDLDNFHNVIQQNKQPNKIIQNTNENGRSLIKKLIPYAVAASIILALGLFLYTNQTPSNSKLFAKHFTPDPGLPTTMGTTKNYEFYNAMVNYKRKEYNLAIHKWEILQKNDAENDTLNYFLGVAYLAKGNEKQAQKYLKVAAKNSKGFLKNETYYYLGLAYLKSNNPQEAMENFKKSNLESSRTILEELYKK